MHHVSHLVMETTRTNENQKGFRYLKPNWIFIGFFLSKRKWNRNKISFTRYVRLPIKYISECMGRIFTLEFGLSSTKFHIPNYLSFDLRCYCDNNLYLWNYAMQTIPYSTHLTQYFACHRKIRSNLFQILITKKYKLIKWHFQWKF